MGEKREGQADALNCELCAGSGVVPTRSPDETGELYDDCRGCVDGERLTGAEAEALRDRADRAEADAQVARWELGEARTEVAQLTDDLRRECEASQQIAAARDAAEARAARLEEAVGEFLAAEDAVDREAERAGGTPNWSSAPLVRRINAVRHLRALIPTGADHV